MPEAAPSDAPKTEQGRLAFVPLEANPELLTTLAHNLGLSEALQFCDVYSLTEPSLLEFIPRPALALLLVFPVSTAYEEHRSTEDAARVEYDGKGDADPLWFKQTIRNACGLMGMIHAMLNGPAREFITSDSTLDKLFKAAVPTGRADRVKLLETDEFIARAYGEVAMRGDTAAPDARDDVDLHYVCFVKDDKGRLWELDGRRKGPLLRKEGLNAEEDVLSPGALEMGPLEFLKRGGGDMRFSCVALTQG